jgi:hypothetical protein
VPSRSAPSAGTRLAKEVFPLPPHARQHAFETKVSVWDDLKFSLAVTACVRACEGRKVGTSVGLSVFCERRCDLISSLVTSRVFDRTSSGMSVAADEYTCIADGSSANEALAGRFVHSTIWGI